MTRHVVVHTTTDDIEVARRLATSAVAARVAACAQIEGPVTSVYRWDGAVQTATEWRITFKSSTARFDALRRHIVANHPYQVPEIVAVGVVDGDERYLRWVDSETSPGRADGAERTDLPGLSG